MKTMNVVLAGAATLLAACSDSSGPGSTPDSNFTLSFSTVTPGAVSASRVSPGFSASVAADTLVSGADTLVITRAEIVVRELELKRAGSLSCDSTVDDDGCEKLELGPILVDLPLSGTTEQQISVQLLPGSYDEIEFEIHKISSDDEEDAAFRQAHPDFAGISIRVQGTFNGVPFVYTTDLDVEQEFDLGTPLVIDENTTDANVTMRIDLSAWFRTAGGALVDPQSGNKGGANESLVKENIKQSVEAFEDHDHDGHDDHGDDDDS